MTTVDAARRLLAAYPHINEMDTWGETAFFYNPDGKPRGKYLCTVKRGNEFNYASDRAQFTASYGKIARGTHAFTGRRRPHEHYAWMQWMTLVDPSEQEMRAAIQEAWQRVAGKTVDIPQEKLQ